MSTHPYADAAPWRLWRRAVAAPAPQDVDPVVDFPFRITPQSRVVTAGSCFAQHIARHLRQSGYCYHVTEAAHPLLDGPTAEAFGYGIYSARYGNVYTARQLLQLARRAYGQFVPREEAWAEDGRFFDPFRPAIQPGGFASRLELQLDQAQHFAALRRALAELDVFIFTLGLTECWESIEDGAVFPLCPGTAHGRFDAAKYRLRVLTVDETVQDLREFLTLLRQVNPAARAILTVSPVPLVATAENQHVLVATVAAKSVLRAAADVICREGLAAYFPSYEIVTSPAARGAYFAADLRSVTEAGVAHVMGLFFRHAASGATATQAPAPATPDAFAVMREAVAVLCDEELLDAAPADRRNQADAIYTSQNSL
jgi:hypothetical protein